MRILFLDDDAERHKHFRNQYKEEVVVEVYTAAEAINKLLNDDRFDIVFLDHSLGGEEDKNHITGMNVAVFMTRELPEEKWPEKVIVHSWDILPARIMVEILQQSGFDAEARPFHGSKKLYEHYHTDDLD